MPNTLRKYHSALCKHHNGKNDVEPKVKDWEDKSNSDYWGNNGKYHKPNSKGVSKMSTELTLTAEQTEALALGETLLEIYTYTQDFGVLTFSNGKMELYDNELSVSGRQSDTLLEAASSFLESLKDFVERLDGELPPAGKKKST